MSRIATAFAAIAVSVVFASSPVRGAEPASCYTLEKGSPDAGIGMMTIGRDGSITFATTVNPHAAYTDSCEFPENGPVICSLGCDGGSITLMQAGEGLLADFAGRRIESIRMESVVTALGTMEADGADLTGSFYLKPAPVSVCQASDNLAQPLLMEPGDLYPAVRRLEKYLLVGGYFADAPDWYYTAETAEAVKLFQSEIGVEPTGKTDRALLALIGVHASYAFGGC